LKRKNTRSIKRGSGWRWGGKGHRTKQRKGPEGRGTNPLGHRNVFGAQKTTVEIGGTRSAIAATGKTPERRQQMKRKNT